MLNRSERPDGREDTDIQHHAANNSWRLWCRQLIHDDTHGVWFAFTLNSPLSVGVLLPKLARRCEAVCQHLRLEPSHSRARTRRRGVCAFVVPAVSAGQHEHCHGMLRVPRLFAEPWMPITIREHSAAITIHAPQLLTEVFRTQFGTHTDTAFMDLNVMNDGTKAVPLSDDPKAADKRAWNYWTKKTDGEWRAFEHAIFTPHCPPCQDS